MPFEMMLTHDSIFLRHFCVLNCVVLSISVIALVLVAENLSVSLIFWYMGVEVFSVC